MTLSLPHVPSPNFHVGCHTSYAGYGARHSLNSRQQSILSLPQLLEWPLIVNNPRLGDSLNKATIPLRYCKWEECTVDHLSHIRQKKGISLAPPRRPLVLVCHDMGGNYFNDALNCGSHGNREEGNTELPVEYTHHFWTAIDVYVYFSHDFIAIPPPSWINVAHKHQVLILGTLITEHNQGVELTHSIIDDEKRRMVFKLRIESKTRPKRQRSIDERVFLFRLFIIGISQRIPWAKVIWYDSISIETSTVAWQNRLNKHGLSFFDACELSETRVSLSVAC